jgi:hypothetical protein
MRAVIPTSCGGFPARILRGRDEFEVAVFQLFVKFLPARQIKPAASPGGPSDNKNFLAAKVRQMNDAAGTVGHGEIRGNARLIEFAAHGGNLAEAPDPGILNINLAKAARKASEVEPFGSLQLFCERNAHIGAACALRLDLEPVDARQIGGANPEIFGIGPDFIYRSGGIAVKNRCCRRSGRVQRRRGGGEQELAAIHHVKSLDYNCRYGIIAE